MDATQKKINLTSRLLVMQGKTATRVPIDEHTPDRLRELFEEAGELHAYFQIIANGQVSRSELAIHMDAPDQLNFYGRFGEWMETQDA